MENTKEPTLLEVVNKMTLRDLTIADAVLSIVHGNLDPVIDRDSLADSLQYALDQVGEDPEPANPDFTWHMRELRNRVASSC